MPTSQSLHLLLSWEPTAARRGLESSGDMRKVHLLGTGFAVSTPVLTVSPPQLRCSGTHLSQKQFQQVKIPAHRPPPSVWLLLLLLGPATPWPSPLCPCPLLYPAPHSAPPLILPPPHSAPPLTHHQLCKADVQLLWVGDRTGELHVLQRVVVPEVDLREVAAPKAAQEAQAMAAPLAGGHGHCRPGGQSAGRCPRSSS